MSFQTWDINRRSQVLFSFRREWLWWQNIHFGLNYSSNDAAHSPCISSASQQVCKISVICSTKGDKWKRYANVLTFSGACRAQPQRKVLLLRCCTCAALETQCHSQSLHVPTLFPMFLLRRIKNRQKSGKSKNPYNQWEADRSLEEKCLYWDLMMSLELIWAGTELVNLNMGVENSR